MTILDPERLIAFLDHRPLFYGHTLLVPKQHMVLLSDLPADQVPEFFGTAQRLERAIEDGLPSDGSMILINNVVSQSVPHLHLHVIPRNKRDGLRFWLGPRKRYDAAAPAEAYAERIRAALPRRPEPRHLAAVRRYGGGRHRVTLKLRRTGRTPMPAEFAGPNGFARELFDGLPDRYDRLAELLSFGQNGRWRAAMVGRACRWTAWPEPAWCLMWRRGPRGWRCSWRGAAGKVVGVDLTEAMLREGRRRVAAAGRRHGSGWWRGRPSSCRFPTAASTR